MTKAKKPSKKPAEETAKLEQEVGELTQDLQRLRADFENYRKRTEQEVAAARQSGANAMVVKLLPVIDTLDRGLRHTPKEIADNSWVRGVQGITKSLDKVLEKLEVEKIQAAPGDEFNPDLHHAIQIDEEATGDKEVIAEELQAGYLRSGVPIRHAMVKVTRE